MFWSFCLNKMAHDEVREAEERRHEESRRREQERSSSQAQSVSAMYLMSQLTADEREPGPRTNSEPEAVNQGQEAGVNATSPLDVTLSWDPKPQRCSFTILILLGVQSRNVSLSQLGLVSYGSECDCGVA